MSEKVVTLTSTGLLEKAVGNASSAGSADAGKLVALDTGGRIDVTMMPTGVGPATITRPASEALAAGAVVDIYSAAGTSTARNADASVTSKTADGYVLQAVASGANATVYTAGIISGLTGLTIDAVYYLSPTTPGAITTTMPTGSGQVAQSVGVALSATELLFLPGTPVQRA